MATAERVTEYRRFTLSEAYAGLAEGWVVAGNSCYRFGGGWWAWFTREVESNG